jgi:hypothetical protein
MRTSTLLFISAFVLAIPSAAFASDACSCWLGNGPLGVQPNAVPPNVKLFVPAGYDRSIFSLAKVVDEVSQPIPFHFEDAPEGTGDGWIVPDAPLDPMATYEFVQGKSRQPFTTSPGEDTIAPTFTNAGFVPYTLSGACEDHVSAALQTEGAADDTTMPGLWTWRVSIKSPATTMYLSPQSGIVIGRMETWGGCMVSFPAAELEKKFDATLVAFDWAGNASREVSTTIEFAEGGMGCGCWMTGTSKSTEMSTLFVGALALLVFRRRKH